MLRHRVIPALLLRGESLVKTVRFGRFVYVGDPCNTVRIFNELEVDELLFLDITATRENRGPNLRVLQDIANECFMPLSYGGGIRSLDDARAVFEIGIEKVALNSAALENPQLIADLAECYGRQAVIVSIDEKIDWLGRRRVYRHATGKSGELTPAQWAVEAERRGAGEILLTSVAREGMWAGFDLDGIKEVTAAVTVPVIAHGGAGSVADLGRAIKAGGASAVAAGSLVVFQRKGMGVLVNFPEREALAACVD